VSLRRRKLTELTSIRQQRLDATEIVSPSQARDPLWVEVRRLPRRQAQVVVLHYLEQFTTAEIAMILEISQPAVKTHLQRARSTLAERFGGVDADAR
jgi:RNA polymerase sigma-70 factor, ECF subfamily